MAESPNQAKASDSTKAIGCLLLGAFPIIVVISIFVAGSLEESGNKIAGWLWIPFSIFVMLMHAFFSYRLSARPTLKGDSPKLSSNEDWLSDELKTSTTTSFDSIDEPTTKQDFDDHRLPTLRPPSCARYIVNYVALQILVLLVIGLIAMAFVHFTGLSGFGGDGR